MTKVQEIARHFRMGVPLKFGNTVVEVACPDTPDKVVMVRVNGNLVAARTTGPFLSIFTGSGTLHELRQVNAILRNYAIQVLRSFDQIPNGTEYSILTKQEVPNGKQPYPAHPKSN